MERLGLEFEVMSPDIDESVFTATHPFILTLDIAEAKATAVRGRVAGGALIVCSDQVAVWGGKIRGKPADADEARAFLADYGREPVEAVSSLVVMGAASGRTWRGVDSVKVFFAPVPAEAVEKAVSRGLVMQSAGGYAIEDPDLAPFVLGLKGMGSEQDNWDSVFGLPTRLLRAAFRHFARNP